MALGQLHLGFEIRLLIERELGVAALQRFEDVLQEDRHTINQLQPKDIPFISSTLVSLFREEIGYERTERLTKIIEKIKAINELAEIEHEPTSPANQKKISTLHLKIGKLSIATHTLDEAAIHLKRVIRLSLMPGEETNLVEAFIGMGNLCRNRHEWQRAVDYYRQALVPARGLPGEDAAKVLNGLGNARWQLGDYTGARTHLQEADTLAAAAGNHELQGNVQNILGLICNDTGDQEGSRRHLRTAAELFEKEGSSLDVAMVYNNLGDSYLMTKEPERAIKEFAACRLHAEKVRHEKWIGWSLFNEGEARLMQGDADGCIEASSRAIELLEPLKDWKGSLAACRNLAQGYARKGDWQRVDESLAKAKAFAERHNNPFSTAHLLLEWGGIEMLRGSKDLAMSKLEESLRIFKEIKATPWVERTVAKLAELGNA